MGNYYDNKVLTCSKNSDTDREVQELSAQQQPQQIVQHRSQRDHRPAQRIDQRVNARRHFERLHPRNA